MNRATLLTPPGGAAIAVVLILGPGVNDFLSRHFSRAVKAGRCVHGELRDGERILDDPVVVLSEDGPSAELSLHGGPWVIRSVLDLAQREGFEIISPLALPLPNEAVNGRTSFEREVLTHLPLARTELGIRALLAQQSAWGGGERAGMEASPSSISAPAADLAEPLLPESLDPNDRGLWWLLHPPRVAMVGAANVGKSTLANQLFAQQRSITADLPGTTRDWVGEIANVNGLPVMLIDTPGLRATSDAIEADAIERAREQIGSADLVLLVLDPIQPLDPDQRPLLDAFPQAIRIINKSDQPPAWQPDDAPTIRTIATSGQGVEELRRAITRCFGCDAMDLSRPRWWTRGQRDQLLRL